MPFICDLSHIVCNVKRYSLNIALTKSCLLVVEPVAVILPLHPFLVGDIMHIAQSYVMTLRGEILHYGRREARFF